MKMKTRGQERASAGTILVIDDEGPILDLCRELIQRLGYKVQTASSGAEALSVASSLKGSISLVLLDINLPDMAMGAVIAGLKKIDRHIKIVIHSGEILSEDEINPDSYGICGFLHKPYGIEEFTQKLDQALLYSNEGLGCKGSC